MFNYFYKLFAFVFVTVYLLSFQSYNASNKYLGNNLSSNEFNIFSTTELFQSPVVDTQYGKVQGTVSESGIMSFLGIPYAASPIDENRFLSPQPHVFWEDVFDATEYGATASQLQNGEPLDDLFPNVIIEGDDCLNLNIWTNGVQQQKPVMVFIHGGAFISGSGAISGYDGSNFARDGVVLITINYRLGAEGFLWFGDGEANLGIKDQIAALKWVNQNIANFGGNPNNVTIFGESAGASSIATLLAIPEAQNYFQRAIIQSGTADNAIGIDEAKQRANEFADILGVENSREGISTSSMEDILEAQKQLQSKYGLAFVPVVDGVTLMQNPTTAILSGSAENIDVMIGNNTQESFLLFAPTETLDDLTRFHFYLIAYQYNIPILEAQKIYFSENSEKDMAGVINQLITDIKYRIPSAQIAQVVSNSFVYEFDWSSPAFDGTYGSSHGVELPFVFDNLNNSDWETITGGIAPQALATEMHAAWVEFAKNGNPGWDNYTSETRTVKVFGEQSVVVQNPHANATAFWFDTVLNQEENKNPNLWILIVIIVLLVIILAMLVVGVIFAYKKIKKYYKAKHKS